MINKIFASILPSLVGYSISKMAYLGYYKNLFEYLPAGILGHVFLKLGECLVSCSKFINDDLGFVLVYLKNHISVSSLHSEVGELSHTIVGEVYAC